MLRFLLPLALSVVLGGLLTSCGSQAPSTRNADVEVLDDLGRTWKVHTTGTDATATVPLTPPPGVTDLVFGTVQYDDDGNSPQTDLASGLTVVVEREPDATELWVVAEDEGTREWIAQKLVWE